jgi:glucose-6-phosphate 1-dehydrogenase
VTVDRDTPSRAGAARARVGAGDIAPAACGFIRPTDPCAVLILGATGDLTSRKLMPALFNLFLSGGLPEPFAVVGAGRTAWSDEEFRERMRASVDPAGAHAAAWGRFGATLFYRRLDYADEASTAALVAEVEALEHRAGTRGNRIVYLALPPALYRPVAVGLGKAGLGKRRRGGRWSRIVLEKPFGSDLASALDLDRSLHAHFAERQIFRIDHYLAKETVQNVLMFRFANSIFEPLWNRRYVDHVRIVASEAIGVEHRAGYYEGTGVLRDMFQNHMLQLLSLIAMEPPPRFEAELVRDEKAKVFSALRPFPTEALESHLVLGQYGPGRIDGAEVPGYRSEEGVNPASTTPTYASMKAFIDNWRWQGVPFFITSGKRLSSKATEIAIQFKQVPHAMFRHTLGESIAANRLRLCISPEEKIELTFQAKTPGAAVCLRTVTMDFDYHEDHHGPTLEAYEKALLDSMLGDPMLFWRQDGVELAWSFLDPVLKACETCPAPGPRLHLYPAGSDGPADGLQLVEAP